MKTNVILLVFENEEMMQKFDNEQVLEKVTPFNPLEADTILYFYEEWNQKLYDELVIFHDINLNEGNKIKILTVNKHVNKFIAYSTVAFKISNNGDINCIRHHEKNLAKINEILKEDNKIINKEKLTELQTKILKEVENHFNNCISTTIGLNPNKEEKKEVKHDRLYKTMSIIQDNNAIKTFENVKYINALAKAVNFKISALDGSREIVIDVRDDLLDNSDITTIVNKITEEANHLPINITIFVNELTTEIHFKLLPLIEIMDLVIYFKNNQGRSANEVECVKCRDIKDNVFNGEIYLKSIKEKEEKEEEKKEDVYKLKEVIQGIRMEDLSVILLVKGLDNDNNQDASLIKYGEKIPSIMEKYNIEIDSFETFIFSDFNYSLVQEAVDSLESVTGKNRLAIMNIQDNEYCPEADKVLNVLTRDTDILIVLDLAAENTATRLVKNETEYSVLNNCKFTYEMFVDDKLTCDGKCEICDCKSLNEPYPDVCDEILEKYDEYTHDVVIVLGEEKSLLYLDSELHSEIENGDLIDTLETLTDEEVDEWLIDIDCSTFNIVCRNRLMSQKVYDLRERLLDMFVY